MEILDLLSLFDDDLGVFIKTETDKMYQPVVADVLQIALQVFLALDCSARNLGPSSAGCGSSLVDVLVNLMLSEKVAATVWLVL